MPPDVGTAADLPATGATETPATETEAVALYAGAPAALGDAMQVLTAGSARTTSGETVPLDYSGTYGGGTIDMHGSMVNSMTFPEATASMDDMTMNIDFSYSQNYGTAFSVRRDDGVGAKFMITFSKALAKSNLTTENMYDFSNLFTDLSAETADLKVYDDANVLVGDYDVPLTELGDLAVMDLEA